MSLAPLLLAAVAAAPGPLLVTPAVLEDPGARAEPWLGPAAAELLCEALEARGVSVLDPEDVRLAAGRLELPAGAPSRAATLRLAGLLRAPAAIVLSASLRGDSLTLSARLLEAEVLGSPTAVSGPLSRLGGVVTALAERLAADSKRLAAAPALSEAVTLDWARGLGGEDLEARRSSLERAVAAAPDHNGPRYALGALLREMGEPAAAADAFAAVRGPARARRAALQRGLALLEAGRAAAAAELFEALVRGQSTPAALNARAVALLRSHPGAVPDEVFVVLERAAVLAPDSSSLAFNRAWAELRAGRAGAAAKRLGELMTRQPRDALARLARVWALGQIGQPAARDAEWEALLALAPGLAAFSEPDLSRPLERLIESEHPLACGADPRDAAERAADALGRAERLLSAGAFETAWREASQAVYLDAHRARAHLVLARTLRARGEDEAALRALRVALWSQEDPDVRRELVLYLEELGHGADARAEARALLDADPRDPVGLRMLAR